MTAIHVRFMHVGVHCWPGAPDEQKYLRDKHRHVFHIRVSCEVRHDDREIEFHALQHRAKGLLTKFDLGEASCEDIARDMSAELCRHYGRPVTVTVEEDGECGATVTT